MDTHDDTGQELKRQRRQDITQQKHDKLDKMYDFSDLSNTVWRIDINKVIHPILVISAKSELFLGKNDSICE